MCQVGDIIVVQKYKSRGQTIDRHSFVVIIDEQDEINGIPYDLVCNVMSSFKNDAQKERKMKYTGNFPIGIEDRAVENGNKKEGYIKADQLYYFRKKEIDYKVIGNLKPEIFNALMEFIYNSDFGVEDIIDNISYST